MFTLFTRELSPSPFFRVSVFDDKAFTLQERFKRPEIENNAATTDSVRQQIPVCIRDVTVTSVDDVVVAEVTQLMVRPSHVVIVMGHVTAGG